MGWDPDVLVALIKTNSQINNERVLHRRGADERMKKRMERALKFIKKKELLENESEGELNEQANRPNR